MKPEGFSLLEVFIALILVAATCLALLRQHWSIQQQLTRELELAVRHVDAENQIEQRKKI
jgi:Tfp pilus assembly protein PilV